MPGWAQDAPTAGSGAELQRVMDESPATGGLDTSVAAPEAQEAVIESQGYEAAGVSPSEGRQVEEIVVQARKRAELLEDTPVSISAFDQTSLQERQILQLDALAGFVPNLTILDNRTGRDASILIRGVGARPDVFLDQGVGLYVDGVYLARQQGSILDLVDIASIEVLRGPQGTLFGKNTVGGAVNIITQKPQYEMLGSVRVRAGSFGTVETRSMLNVPIGSGWFEDKLAVRAAFGSNNNSGWTYNTERDEYWNNTEDLNFIGSLRFEPTTNITLDVTGNWASQRSKGRGGECVFIQESIFIDVPGSVTPEYYEYCRDPNRSQPYRFGSDLAGIQESKTWGTWGNITWDTGDLWIFEDTQTKVVGSWREQTWGERADVDLGPEYLFVFGEVGGGEPNGQPAFADQVSAEIQENFSAWEGRIAGVAGFYYFQEEVHTNADIDVFPKSGIVGQLNGAGTNNRIDTDNTSWAFYGQATVDFTDWMSLTGGIRYTKEDRKLSRLVTNLRLCEDGSSPPCSPDNPNAIRANFQDVTTSYDAWTPMGSLALTMPEDWLGDAPIEHLMGYFTYAQGFKAGGINGAARTNNPAEASVFSPETVDSYELGFKTISFDRRLRGSIALFHAGYDDMQLPTVFAEPCPPDNPDCIPQVSVITTNAGQSTIKGIEFELKALPFDGLAIDVSVGLLDAKYDEYSAENLITGLPIERAGERLPFIPETQTHLGVQYSLQVDPPGAPEWLRGWLTPRIDWRYNGSVVYFGTEIPGATADAYSLVDARISYDFGFDSMQVALWGTNLTDSVYVNATYPIPVQILGTMNRFYGQPRTLGGELIYNF